MSAAVSCTGCHDFGRKHSRAAVGEKCVGCHEAPYTALMSEWTTGFDADLKTTVGALKRAAVVVAVGAGEATSPPSNRVAAFHFTFVPGAQ